jgi:tRNA (guanine37-N1)-methyltransferase
MRACLNRRAIASLNPPSVTRPRLAPVLPTLVRMIVAAASTSAKTLDCGPPASVPKLAQSLASTSSCYNKDVSRELVTASLDSLKPAFARKLQLVALRVPAREVGQLRKASVPIDLLCVPRLSNITKDPQSNATKLALLPYSTPAEVPASVVELAKSSGWEIQPHQVNLDYDFYSADEILGALLPEDPQNQGGTPTGYTIIGHIAHLNLRDEYLPFRKIIGQVILEKNPSIKTVVNKLDSIDSEFRFFEMELLAGEPEFVTTASESNCLFTFDFRKVYFNSRLHTEHGRIVSLLQPGEVISDVMAGVGPFAIPAAKKGCIVYANDLNPASYESLKGNTVKNKVSEGCLTYCEDGRAFIKESVKRAWRREIKAWSGPKSTKAKAKEDKARRQQQKQQQQVNGADAAVATTNGTTAASSTEEAPLPSPLIDHFIMNLPASALEFLDAYRGAYKELAAQVGQEELEAALKVKGQQMGSLWPMVHVHCFTKDLETPEEDICQRANQALGTTEGNADRLSPGQKDLSLHWVRRVAPNKDMYCLSFRLSRGVLFDE